MDDSEVHIIRSGNKICTEKKTVEEKKDTVDCLSHDKENERPRKGIVQIQKLGNRKELQ